MKVYVTIYEHRHGVDTCVFATFAGAEAQRQSIAEEWWDHELGATGPGPSADKPEDLAELADDYWARIEDENFSIEECAVLPANRYCVDGVAGDDTYQGDGQGAPFRIFDIEAQRNLPGDYLTRGDAESVLALLV